LILYLSGLVFTQVNEQTKQVKEQTKQVKEQTKQVKEQTKHNMSLILLVILSAVSQKNTSQNITRCQEIYNDRILTPMGINYLPLSSLQQFIRYYNYKTFRRRIGRSKSERRKLRNHYHKNYVLYSHSEELDYMPTLCEIQYDKLNVKQIKLKYEWTKFRVESQQITDTFVISSIIFIMTFIFILACSS